MKKRILISLATVSIITLFMLLFNERQIDSTINNDKSKRQPNNALVSEKSSKLQSVEKAPNKKNGLAFNKLNEQVDLESERAVSIKEIELKYSYPNNLFSEFESLKELADNGDIEASLILGQTLQECAYEPKTYKEYNEAISVNLSLPMRFADDGYKLCKGITQDHLKLSTIYLEKAAEAGDLEAQISLFRAVPLEIEGYSDDYVAEKGDLYLESLNKRKLDYMEKAVKSGNITAAYALGSTYMVDYVPTVTGLDHKKALINLELALLMDPNESRGIAAMREYASLKTPVYIVEEAKREAAEIFKTELNGKEFTYLQERNYSY